MSRLDKERKNLAAEKAPVAADNLAQGPQTAEEKTALGRKRKADEEADEGGRKAREPPPREVGRGGRASQ